MSEGPFDYTSPTIWLTRDGRAMRIFSMSTSHLRSAIAYFRVRGMESRLAVENGSQEWHDIAEAQMLAGAKTDLLFLRYKNLLAELKRREDASMSTDDHAATADLDGRMDTAAESGRTTHR